MKLIASTIGFGSAVSVAAVSGIAVSHLLNNTQNNTYPTKDLDLTDISGILTEDGAAEGDFVVDQSFNTRNVNRDSNQPPLSITKSFCFESFFPGIQLQRPTQQSEAKKVTDIVPTGFSFRDNHQVPRGCKVMKMSKSKQDEAFGYLSETAVKNESFGLALYSAATNLKTKDKIDEEHWLLFLNKQNDGSWKLNTSYYWTVQTQSTSGFSLKTPDNVQWSWSHSNPSSDTLTQLLSDSVNTHDLWPDESKNLFYAGSWQAESNNTKDLQIFNGGSHERKVIKQHFGHATSNDQAIPFLKELKLNHKGKWKNLGDVCKSTNTTDSGDLTNLCSAAKAK